MRRRRRGATAGIAAAAVLVAGCSHPPAPSDSAGLLPDSALSGLLLSAGDVQSMMSGAPLIAQPVDSAMDDNRNLLPNLNCLGVWHPGEAAVYGGADDGSWRSVRRQLLRAPGNDQWRSSVVQSVTSYSNADTARAFLARSADRWGKCTNHTVNITLNDQRLPRWRSGDLESGPDRLRMPISRAAGAATSSCEHVIAVRANVVIDVLACVPQTVEVRRATQIADRIASHVPG
ncbi:MAG: sensor domain-containing protein [Actinomycetota bacterium]